MSWRVGTLLLAAGILFSCATIRLGSWQQAQQAFNAGDYKQAIIYADNAMSYGQASRDERARATLLKAQSYEKLGQTDQAIALYAFVVREFADTAPAYQSAAALAKYQPERPARSY